MKFLKTFEPITVVDGENDATGKTMCDKLNEHECGQRKHSDLSEHDDFSMAF